MSAVDRRIVSAPDRWDATGQDLVVAAAVAAAQIIGTIGAAKGQPERAALDAVAVLLLLVGPAVLVVRRRFPGAVLGIAASAALLYMLLGYAYGPVMLSVLLAIASAVIAARRVVAWVTVLVLYLAHVSLLALLGDSLSWEAALGVAAWLLVVLIGAEVLRIRLERSRAAARAREQEERRRASEERLRIARDLHDVLGHHISLINVQAGVALHLMDRRPEQARTALEAIEGASREAMGELRSVLAILHRPEEAAPRTPVPGLDQLESLRSRASAAGLDLTIEVDGEPVALHSAVESTAYRVVQESLTNVIRHASATRAIVRLVYGSHRLTIEVVDDGSGMAATGSRTGGRGITGMEERIRTLGGTFEAGTLPGRGFRVRASLPVGGPVT